MFHCGNTSQVSNVTSSLVSDNLHFLPFFYFFFFFFFFFFWLKIKHSFLRLFQQIHLGMQNNRCGPGQTIKDIGSEVCVYVRVCMCV